MKSIYKVVHISTGEEYRGTLPPSHDRKALELALTEMMEIVPHWRGKLQVCEVLG